MRGGQVGKLNIQLLDELIEKKQGGRKARLVRNRAEKFTELEKGMERWLMRNAEGGKE